MKFFVAAVILLAQVSAYPSDGNVCYPNSPHNLTEGDCDDDKMFKMADISANPYYDSYATIPRDDPLEKPIVCIRIIDRKPNNEGGCVSVYQGGIGYRWVTLHFVPQNGIQMLYYIQLFGAKEY